MDNVSPMAFWRGGDKEKLEYVRELLKLKGIKHNCKIISGKGSRFSYVQAFGIPRQLLDEIDAYMDRE